MNRSESRQRCPRLRSTLLMAMAAAAACGGRFPAEDRSVPTFAGEIAPVLFRECVSCHYPEGPAPFSLYTYEDARPQAELIAAATGRRSMPPWLPEPGYAHFAGERRLSDEEIRMLDQWARAGAPAGDLTSMPAAPPPPYGGWQLGEPDLVLEFPAYELSAHGQDTYRNFVVPVAGTETLWVRSVELQPGDPRAVHHARLMVDTTAAARARDQADPQPGFDGMDPVRGVTNPEGFFVGWTPGRVPRTGRKDLAWPLRAGSDLVLQLHLRPTGRSEHVQARIGLHLTEAPPQRRPLLIILGSESFQIPAGDCAFVVVDEYQLPVAVEVLGVYPHAHHLAKRMLGFATLPRGERRWLLRIENWDFNWQDEYRYLEPVPLPAGAMLTMQYTYDNSAGNPRNPHHPPHDISYGPESTDEMADLVIQVLPREETDRDVLEQSLHWRSYTMRIEIDAAYHRASGDSLVASGQLGQGLEEYRRALRLSDDPRIMGAMAGVLLRQGDADAAILVAERAVANAARPDAGLLEILASAYEAAGRRGDAVAAAKRAVQAAEQHRRRGEAAAIRLRWRHLLEANVPSPPR